MATTRVPDMSSGRPTPRVPACQLDVGKAVTGTVGNDRVIVAATAWSRHTRLYLPDDQTLWTRPAESAWRSDGGMTSSPRRATSGRFLQSPVSRRVFRTDRGDSHPSTRSA